MLDLQTLIEPGWDLVSIVWRINNHGQIAGEAYYFAGGSPDTVAVRLDPIPPRLAIRSSATNVVVAWSPAWPGLVLEGASSLSSTNWQPVSTGGTNFVALASTNAMAFFRLNLEGARGLCCPPQ
jgi:hypothetical protein